MAITILIAEDNESVAKAVGGLLERNGFAVTRAADGVTALGMIVRTPPDLLLLDLKLPGLHGVELLKKLRQSPRTRDLPVVVISGIYRGDRYVQAARALGVSHYLEKPFRAAALLAAIQEMLSAAGRPATAPPAATEEPRNNIPPAGETPTAVPAAVEPSPHPAPFDQHLLRAFRERFSGNLRFHYADGERTLTFVNGSPVALRPGFTAANFGDYLRQRGKISAEEYAFYTSSGGERHDTLVQLGCLDYPGLLEEKLGYLSNELLAGFARPPVTIGIEPMPAPDFLQVVTINVPRLIYQGYHRTPPRERLRRFLAECGSHYIAPGGDYYRYINFLPLSEEERQALLKIDGSRTLFALLDRREGLLPLVQTLQSFDMLQFAPAPLTPAGPGPIPLRTLFNAIQEDDEEDAAPEEETLESFADVVEAEGSAELPTPAQAPPDDERYEFALAKKVRQMASDLKGKNYYEIFNLTPARFSFDKVKERYFAITREFGPDALMRLVGEEAAMVQDILATVANAYDTLSDVVKKERYDELLGSERVGLGQKGDDRFQAQVQSQSGKVFIEMEEWDNAEKALQDACNIEPQNGDYLAHLGWAIYRNPKNGNSRAMMEKAKQLVNRALTLERTADGYAFKGWMLLDAGQDSLAEGDFNKALKLDARHGLARRGLRTLLDRREQEKKGLFRRMFS
ncbi:hypothetical protein JCM30471_29260 [Desulfuromonas carbonis]|uniref:response regulator n=1 Tax=Desulfuromonas sp. DDH964 TaxID=1823759 RepID=UPI00078E8018|nr:response regulator [Desulfuromonas sp. DDH964]AMV71105.1 response receiver CheY associated with MCPs of class 40H [Desulfuromonas sp. DDH964]